ncbi:MAG: outer membrane protein assembly factor BamB family protein [Ktedonobacterales bacterium]
MSTPPTCWIGRTARFILALLVLNLLLLTLTSCNMPSLGRVTTSPRGPSPTPASSLTIYAGLNADERNSALIALRGDNGGLRWRMPLDAVGGTSMGATLGDGIIYSASRDVFAVAAFDGALLWNTTLAGLAGEPLTMAGDVLLVPRLGYTQGDEHVDARLDAVEARTGEVVWRSMDVVGQVVAGNGAVYGRSTDGQKLVALRALDGVVLWRVSLGVSTFAVAGEMIYATTRTGDVVELHASDGSIRWKVHLADRTCSSVVVSDDVVYACLGDVIGNQGNTTSNALVALRADDGTQLWRVQLGESEPGTPTVVSGVLYASDGDGLSARRASDGTLLWHVRAADIAPVLAANGAQPYFPDAPTVAHGEVIATISVKYFARASANVIVALDARTGAMRWRYPQNDKLPGFVGGALVVGS